MEIKCYFQIVFVLNYSLTLDITVHNSQTQHCAKGASGANGCWEFVHGACNQPLKLSIS